MSAGKKSFDSILVRLKVSKHLLNPNRHKRFDSILVRLKVAWRAYFSLSCVCEFRFHTGSIKRSSSMKMNKASMTCFDSILVRLKAKSRNVIAIW